MIAIKIKDENKFMGGFLKGNMLDGYTLTEGSITTFCTFTIDGTYRPEFFTSDQESEETSSGESGGMPRRESVPWDQIKELCFQMIRGKHKPLGFKFVFYYPREKVGDLLERHYHLTIPEGEEYGLCMNLRFDQSGLVLTSGVAKKMFSLDKSVDEAWESYLRSFLNHYEIEYEELFS